MKVLTLTLAALATLGATPALAAVSASPAALAAAGGHGFSFTVEGFYIIDFVILVVLLWAVLKGPIKKYLMQRHDKVLFEMEAATRLRKEAEARLAELDRMMSGLEAEIGKVRDQFRADGEREKARILAEAEVGADKIRQNAKKTLEQEMAVLREQLEDELVKSVLESTEAKVRQRLDQATQKRLATSYVDSLEKLQSLGKAA